jgi:hypothetical protein
MPKCLVGAMSRFEGDLLMACTIAALQDDVTTDLAAA